MPWRPLHAAETLGGRSYTHSRKVDRLEKLRALWPWESGNTIYCLGRKAGREKASPEVLQPPVWS